MRRSVKAVAALVAMTALAGVVAAPTHGYYYTTPCRFSSTTIYFYNYAASYASQIASAVVDWSNPTDVTLAGWPYSPGGENIYFQHYVGGNSGPGAYTSYPSCNSSNRWTGRVGIFLNDSLMLSRPSNGRRSTINHEIGHSLSLDHNPRTNNPDPCTQVPVKAIMYAPYTRYTVCGWILPRADDIAGVNNRY
jgi:hypothetical protein